MASSDEEYKALFIASGIDARRADETLRNNHLKKILYQILKQATESGVNVPSIVNLLYQVATNLPSDNPHRDKLTKYIIDKKVGKGNLSYAIQYLKTLGKDPFNPTEFEKECGIGITVSKEDIEKILNEKIEKVKDTLKKERYQYPLSKMLSEIREKLKWADPKELKIEFDKKIEEILGPKTEEDTKMKKKEMPKKTNNNIQNDRNTGEEQPVIKDLVRFPAPSENKQQTPEILEKHLKETGGVVVCRFPPEPNGYLHIGHAKSMNLNFSYPVASGGYTYLRFDDTNPEAEKDEYFQSIISDVEWMGHKPKTITFSSDYFYQLYEFAIQLIKEGKAYVCHQTGDEIAEGREKKIDSPWRDRPIEESLELFEDMRKGKFKEGEATLRLKMDMQSDNTVMRDLIAYRIKYSPHPHTGSGWCIYPSYDYTHCLVDSLENITHSLCTLEFGLRRQSYYWLVDALKLYRPLVWEFSRLNVTHMMMSKRRLIRLVKEGYVRGWDDPRMPTIRGLRRRGYPPNAINNFCDKVGVTRNENLIDIELLEQCCREELDKIANRAMVILDPIRVVITNWKGNVKQVTVPNHPKNPEKGTHQVPFSNVIYIERSDFRDEDIKGYKRLAPNKEVGLLHAKCHILCNEVIRDSSGNIQELRVSADFEPTKAARGYIHWVSQPAPGKEPHTIEVRLYDHLFKSLEPATIEDWTKDINPDSLKVLPNCYADPSIKDLPVGTQLQFERVGYFSVDPDTNSEKQVFNRIVSLKESKSKV